MSRGDDLIKLWVWEFPKLAQVRIQNRKEPPRTCTLIFTCAEPLRELSYHSPILQCSPLRVLLVKSLDLCRMFASPDVTIPKCYESGCESPPRHVTHWSLWILRLSSIGSCKGTSQRLNVAPGAQHGLLLLHESQTTQQNRAIEVFYTHHL